MKNKLILAVVGLLALALPYSAPAQAQQSSGAAFDPQRPVVVQLSAAQATATFPSVSGNNNCSANIAGTFNATLVFEQSNDGQNWTAAQMTVPNVSPSPVPSVTVTYFGTTPMYATPWFRVRVSAYTSGTAIVTVYCTPNAPVYLYH